MFDLIGFVGILDQFHYSEGQISKIDEGSYDRHCSQSGWNWDIVSFLVTEGIDHRETRSDEKEESAKGKDNILEKFDWNKRIRKDSNFTTYRNGRLITTDDSNNPNESEQEKSNASGNQQVLAIHIKTKNMKDRKLLRKRL